MPGIWQQSAERRRSFIRWHSRSARKEWIINPVELTYRAARGLPGRGETIIFSAENDLWAACYRDVPRRDVPQPVYPR